MAEDDVPAREWQAATDDAATKLDSLPFVEAIEDAAAPTAIVEGETSKHPLAGSAEFRAGLEVGRAEGRAEGERAGYARGLTDGRADIRAEDFEAGRQAGYEDFRRALIASGTPAAVALLERDKLRAFARKYPAPTSICST